MNLTLIKRISGNILTTYLFTTYTFGIGNSIYTYFSHECKDGCICPLFYMGSLISPISVPFYLYMINK